MLTALSIRDVVLIEALDLEFGPGLGVLTGETGAGKSILLDALGLALGMRADSGLVRAGQAQARGSAHRQHLNSILVANIFDMSVPVGSLKKASVRLAWFCASTSSGSGRTTLCSHAFS